MNKTNGEDGERELSRKEERKKRATVGKSGGGTQVNYSAHESGNEAHTGS